VCSGDITDFPRLSEIFADVVEEFGGINGLVTSAGKGSSGPFVDYSIEKLQETMNVNVTSPVHTKFGERLM
jgi:short-subunit dehydrogenase